MPRGLKWREHEIEFLESLIGNYPFAEVAKRYQRKANQEGWTERTYSAIKIFSCRRFGTVVAMDKNFSIAMFARILGYPPPRVKEWVYRGKLRVERVGRCTKITTQAINELAKTHPEYFSGADWTGLLFLFSEKRAQELKSYPPARPPKVRVRCKETGTIFPTLSAAGKAVGVNCTTVRKWVNKGQRFEVV